MTKLPDEPEIEVAEPKANETRKPRVFLQIPPSTAKKVSIDDEVQISFRGRVVGMDIHKGQEISGAHVDIEDPNVKVKKIDNDISQLDEDFDDES